MLHQFRYKLLTGYQIDQSDIRHPDQRPAQPETDRRHFVNNNHGGTVDRGLKGHRTGSCNDHVAAFKDLFHTV